MRRVASDDALRSIEPFVGSLRQQVYAALACALPGGLTHEDLVARFDGGPDGFGPSSIRTRCDELVQAGCVGETGELRKTAAGRDAIVWRVCAPFVEAASAARAGKPAVDPPRSVEGAVRAAVAFLGGSQRQIPPEAVRLLLEVAYRGDPSLRWRAGGEPPPERGPGGQTGFW